MKWGKRKRERGGHKNEGRGGGGEEEGSQRGKNECEVVGEGEERKVKRWKPKSRWKRKT